MELTIEYYDREQDYHGIGTFKQVDLTKLSKGDKFIVPPEILHSGKKGYIGVLEGREAHPAYLKPILLTVRGWTETHVRAEGHGAYFYDLCFKEDE